MPLLKKGTKAFSILKYKCPRCHEADLFKSNSVRSITDIYKMDEKCPNCQQPFSLEVGFYWGGMYISYIMSAFLLFGLFALFKFVIGLGFRTSEFLTIGLVLLLWVFIFRISRSIWINVFIHYDPDAKNTPPRTYYK